MKVDKATIACVFTVYTLVSVVLCQTGAPTTVPPTRFSTAAPTLTPDRTTKALSNATNATTTQQAVTEAPNKEYGIILTCYDANDIYGGSAQLRHLPVMPYYQDFSGAVPGIGFLNKYIQFLSVDVDYRMKQIYLYDYHLRGIAVGFNYHAELRPQDLEFEFMHSGVSKGTIQVAVDWVTHTVYWIDSLFKWVVAASGLREKIEQDMYKIIMVSDHSPEGIALDPLEGLMFVSFARPAKINQCTMTGKNCHTIVQTGLHTPRSLEVDIFQGRVYWIDTYYESISSVAYDGTDRQRTRLIPGSSLFDLAIFRDILVVTDIKNQNMYSMNKTTGVKRASTVNIAPETIYGIAMYNIETQPLPRAFSNPENDPCTKCEHMCLLDQVSGSMQATCVCSEEYVLDPITGLCVESPYNRSLVFANRTHICMLDIRAFAKQNFIEECVFTVLKPYFPPVTTTTVPSPPAIAGQNVTGTPGPTTTPRPAAALAPTTPKPSAAWSDEILLFDVNMDKREVYYASAEGSIYARPLDLPLTDTQTELITSVSGTISGLVFDWLGGENVYYCVLESGEFHVVNVEDGAPRRVSTLTFPRSKDLVLLPHERSVAWIQNYMEIHMMDFTGSNHKVLASRLSMAKDLVYEPDEKKLYWLNTAENEIYTVTLDGQTQDFKHYTQSDASHLTLYKNYYMWVYQVDDEDYLVSYQRADTSKFQRVSLGMVDQFGEIVDLKVLDKDTQKMEPDPCKYENGNCEEICITEMTNGKPAKACYCSFGYTLVNGTGCESELTSTDDFIMVSDWTNEAIYQINLRTEEIQAFDNDDPALYLGVLYNPLDKQLYYSESYTAMMWKSPLDGSSKEAVFDLVWADIERMALDMNSGNIYFTSARWTYVGMITPKGVELELIDHAFGFDTFGGIAIHPGKGVLYYAVSKSFDDPYIARANMDGSNVQMLIKGPDVQSPNGITIDYKAGHLYWSDTITNVIQRCDLDAKNCTAFLYDYAANITDITTDGEFLYYVSLNRHHVTRVNLTNSSISTPVGSHVMLGRLTHMSLYKKDNKNTQPVNRACGANGGLGDCSTICLPTATYRTCACEYGTNLKTDGKTCENIYQCDETILQLNGLIDIRFPSCNRLLGDKCDYSCPDGWEPINKTNLSVTCNRDGWSRGFNDDLCKETRCPLRLLNGKWATSCQGRSGEVCKYSCNTGYNPTKNYATCTNSASWDEDLTKLCTGGQCSSIINNGKLDLNCVPKPNVSCSYSCSAGYRKRDPSISQIKCLSSFEWDTNDICIAIGCPDKIVNGGIGNCSATTLPGSKCEYTCNSGFVKPPGVSQMTCLSTEQWDAHGQSPCIAMCNKLQFTCGDGSCINATKKCDKMKDCPDGSDESLVACQPQCPESYGNGTLVPNCDIKVGSVCAITCNTGYTSGSISKVVCSSLKAWTPEKLCQPLFCPALIQSGILDDRCGRGVDSYCTYNCPLGYNKNASVSQLKCLPTGQWNQTNNLCIESNINLMPAKQSSSSGGVARGVGIGFGVMILILILLAVIGFLVYKRRKSYKETPYSMSFDSHGGNIAIENPGYMEHQASSHQDDNDNYATVDPSQMQPAKFVGEDDVPTDHGMVNPVYMEKHSAEPLPEVSQIKLQDDDRQQIHFQDWGKGENEA